MEPKIEVIPEGKQGPGGVPFEYVPVNRFFRRLDVHNEWVLKVPTGSGDRVILFTPSGVGLLNYDWLRDTGGIWAVEAPGFAIKLVSI